MEEFLNGADETVVDFLFHYPHEAGNTTFYEKANIYVAETYALLESQLNSQNPSMMRMSS